MSVDDRNKSGDLPALPSELVRTRIGPSLLGRLDAWAAHQGDISRAEAIRRLLEFALTDRGPKAMLSIEQKVARARRKVANISIPDEPSPQKGVAMLRRGTAEAGLAALKAKKSSK